MKKERKGKKEKENIGIGPKRKKGQEVGGEIAEWERASCKINSRGQVGRGGRGRPFNHSLNYCPLYLWTPPHLQIENPIWIQILFKYSFLFIYLLLNIYLFLFFLEREARTNDWWWWEMSLLNVTSQAPTQSPPT